MAPRAHRDDTVCVMDAAGRLGSALVHSLLRRGYTVHAAVQNGDLHLKGLSMVDSKKLKIFQADSFNFKTILDALRGCSGLFYSFEPPRDQPNYDEFMAEVEVRAAHNVLEACAQTETIDKVVFTSSVTAIVWRPDRKTLDMDERHWSDVSFCRKHKLWHAVSKTLAEKTAWALAMDRGINMVSINAGLLLGPDLSITNPYLKGTAEMYEDGVFVTVDLTFLAAAHICAFEDASSYGRYLCFNSVVNTPDHALKLASSFLSSLPQPPQSCGEMKVVIRQGLHNDKLERLMAEFED